MIHTATKLCAQGRTNMHLTTVIKRIKLLTLWAKLPLVFELKRDVLVLLYDFSVTKNSYYVSIFCSILFLLEIQYSVSNALFNFELNSVFKNIIVKLFFFFFANTQDKLSIILGLWKKIQTKVK